MKRWKAKQMLPPPDQSTINYLIGDISGSDKENETPIDVDSATNSTNRVPMEVNVVVETVKETNKPKNKIQNHPRK